MNNQTSPMPAANTKRHPLLARCLVGFLLGFISLFLLFFLGETFGDAEGHGWLGQVCATGTVPRGMEVGKICARLARAVRCRSNWALTRVG